MKKLLTFCSLLAGYLLHFHAQAQTPPPHVQGTSAVQAISGMDAQVSPGMQVPDSLLRPDVSGKPPGTGYNGHLLVQKVPPGYHGHLLVKTPRAGNKHLRVVPPAGTKRTKLGVNEFRERYTRPRKERIRPEMEKLEGEISERLIHHKIKSRKHPF